VISAAERGLVDDDDRPVVSDPAQLRAAPPAAPAAPPPPPPPPPVAPPEADLLPAVEPGGRDGAGVLPAAPAETDPDRIGVEARPERRCTVAGCDQPLRAVGRCRQHYEQAYRAADRAPAPAPAPTTEQPAPPAKRPLRPRCSYHLCRSRSAIGATFCTRHAASASRPAPQTPEGPRQCSAAGCQKVALARGLCNAHYQQNWQAQKVAKLAELGLPPEPRRRRLPAPLDKAARDLWARLQTVPALGPWCDDGAAVVRRRLSDQGVAARLVPSAGKLGGKVRWDRWTVEAVTPEGDALRLDGAPSGRAQAQVVVDTLLRSAGWGLA
jgi:hypothetical protein